MPTFIKHVGQVSSTGKKCVVVFRSVPGDSNSCLVVETESLPDLYHDKLIEAVESPSAQAEPEFFNFANRSVFHDGENMLQAMHIRGWMKKLPTTNVTMMPTPDIKITLSDLNDQLERVNNDGQENGKDVLSDQQIANQMRSQAAFFKKEAERLYAEAEALDPQTTASVAATTEAPKQKRTYNKKK